MGVTVCECNALTRQQRLDLFFHISNFVYISILEK